MQKEEKMERKMCLPTSRNIYFSFRQSKGKKEKPVGWNVRKCHIITVDKK